MSFSADAEAVSPLPNPVNRLPAGWGAALAVALAVLPFFIPVEVHLARAVLAGYAISIGMKLRILVVGRDFDPAMVATLPRLVLWLFTPHVTRWPSSTAEARSVRRQAAPALLGAIARAVAMLMVVAVKLRLEPLPLLGRSALEMLEFYLLLAALAEGIAGLLALGGIAAEPVFRWPVAARSPAEFWSRRWNLVVHRFARCHLFIPAVRHHISVPSAVALTFAASGVMHEYLAAAAVGLPLYRPGFMLAFFGLQAIAVLLVSALRRGRRPLPAPLAAGAHLAWLMATAWLFFTPLRPQITAFDAACAALLRPVVP